MLGRAILMAPPLVLLLSGLSLVLYRNPYSLPPLLLLHVARWLGSWGCWLCGPLLVPDLGLLVVICGSSVRFGGRGVACPVLFVARARRVPAWPFRARPCLPGGSHFLLLVSK